MFIRQNTTDFSGTRNGKDDKDYMISSYSLNK